jgi:CRP-like cAMP-binding protein
MVDLITARQNRLLAHFPDHVLARVLGRADVVDFPVRALIQSADERAVVLQFPLTGMLSVVTRDTSGTAVEVATIGREGVAGMLALFGAGPLPFDVMWQLPGRAVVVDLGEVRPLLTSEPAVAHILGRYLGAFMAQTGQNAGCNRLHAIEQRAAKWLLLCRDRVEADTFELTQEFLAIMLGVTRPKLSVVQAAFQRAGFISYARGTMRILDGDALTQQSCDCYRIIADQIAALDPPD